MWRGITYIKSRIIDLFNLIFILIMILGESIRRNIAKNRDEMNKRRQIKSAAFDYDDFNTYDEVRIVIHQLTLINLQHITCTIPWGTISFLTHAHRSWQRPMTWSIAVQPHMDLSVRFTVSVSHLRAGT